MVIWITVWIVCDSDPLCRFIAHGCWVTLLEKTFWQSDLNNVLDATFIWTMSLERMPIEWNPASCLQERHRCRLSPSSYDRPSEERHHASRLSNHVHVAHRDDPSSTISWDKHRGWGRHLFFRRWVNLLLSWRRVTRGLCRVTSHILCWKVDLWAMTKHASRFLQPSPRARD